jgi:hypothetical protein
MPPGVHAVADVYNFAQVFQVATAVPTCTVYWCMHSFFTRQMWWQRLAFGFLARRHLRWCLGLGDSLFGFEIFQLQLQLFDLLVQLFGAAAKLHALEFGQHQFQMLDLGGARRLAFPMPMDTSSPPALSLRQMPPCQAAPVETATAEFARMRFVHQSHRDLWMPSAHRHGVFALAILAGVVILRHPPHPVTQSLPFNCQSNVVRQDSQAGKRDQLGVYPRVSISRLPHRGEQPSLEKRSGIPRYPLR